MSRTSDEFIDIDKMLSPGDDPKGEMAVQEAGKSRKGTKKKLPPVEGMSLLDYLETILDLSEDAGLDDACLKKARPYMEALAARLHVTPLQAALFAHFVGRGDDQDIRLGEIQNTLQCKPVKMLKYLREFDTLVERKLLIENQSGYSKKSYAVPDDIIEALRGNGEIKIIEPGPLDTDGFFDELERLFDLCSDTNWETDRFVRELKKLLERGRDLPIVQTIKTYHLPEGSLALLLLFCEHLVNNDDDDIDLGDVRRYFTTMHDFRRAKSALTNHECELFSQGLIECTGTNGFENREEFRLTSKAKEELLGELDLDVQNAKMKNGLILCRDIVEKPMYYNPREEKLVDKLCSLLQPERFASVRERLKTKNMRTGFACLFYGKPGTGKTETVNLLARKTGRDILLVDIAETKSCWFGESEKQIKKVFDRYRAFVKVNNPEPILLFNEADGVISKRKDVSSGNVAQTENAMQNIILQELESLEGILIATTNLTQNLDSAFERRFLYKIDFAPPSLEARTAIWKLQIPELSDGDARSLAERFDFTGGQIENIARKRTVDSIIEGTAVSLETLAGYCREEKIDRERGGRIGFLG